MYLYCVESFNCNFSFIQQIFVGKTDNLTEELTKHFESFGQKRHLIREIDDELCHHTDSSGWNVRYMSLFMK